MPSDPVATAALSDLVNLGYLNCAECPPAQVNRDDAEDCEACCEHWLCPYHQGAEAGAVHAIDTAQKAWGV